MDLYYAPGACSLASRIALEEAALPYRAIRVDLRSKTTEHGEDFKAIAAKGYVPLLVLDDGTHLSEGVVILQYVADQVPGKGLIPAAGSMDRYRVQEWLNFVCSELHKRFGLLFNPSTPEAMKAIVREQLAQKAAWVNRQMEGRRFAVGASFTVADVYLGWALRGLTRLGFELQAWPALQAVHADFMRRPAVLAAMRAEGLPDA